MSILEIVVITIFLLVAEAIWLFALIDDLRQGVRDKIGRIVAIMFITACLIGMGYFPLFRDGITGIW